MDKNTENTKAPAPETMEQALAIITEQGLVIESLTAERAADKEQIEVLTSSLQELNDTLASKEASPAKASVKLTVKHGKSTYEIASGVRLAGTVYTPQQLSESPDAVAAVLAIEGQQILILKEGGSK